LKRRLHRWPNGDELRLLLRQLAVTLQYKQSSVTIKKEKAILYADILRLPPRER